MSKQALNQTTIYAISNICNKAVSFLMLPVFTRFLSPTDFGVIALLVFSLAIFQTVLGARLGHALPKFYHEKKSNGENPNLVISLLLFFYRVPLSNLIFGTEEYALVTGIFFICLITQAIEIYGFVYLRIMEKAKLFLYVSIIKLFLQLALNIYLIVFLKLGVMGVAISAAAFTGILAIYFTWYLVKEAGLGYEHQTAKDLILYSIPLWFSTLAIIYIWSSSRYFIRIYSSLEDVGLFELAGKMASILIAIFWEPFVMYWNTKRFDLYYQKSKKAVYSITFDVAILALTIGAIGVSIFAEPVITLMANETFHSSSSAVTLLVLGSMFYALSEYNNLGLMVKNKTKYIAGIDIFCAVILTAFFVLLIPIMGFQGAAVAMLIAQLCQFLIYYYISKQSFDMELKFGFFFKSMLIVLATLLADYFLANHSNIFLNILIKIIIFASGTTIICIAYYRIKANKDALLNIAPSLTSKFGFLKRIL